MSQLKCDYKIVGPVQTNCYMLSKTDTNECIIVDPGEEAAKLSDYMEKKELKPIAILLTHGHFDHIGAVDELRKKYNIKVYAAKEEEETLKNPDLNLSSQFGAGFTVEADEYLKDGQQLELLGENVKCILTPGHTKGGMCYYFGESGILFSGDTLFLQSVGRTDFPGGSMSEIIRSIREKLFVLPDYVRVYTGHGLMTNIKDEKMLNPFAVE